MAIILPQLQRQETGLEKLASGLGSGLGVGLQNLANMKIQQYQQQQQINKGAQFWKGLGLNDQMAYQFASAPEAVQKSILDRLEGLDIGSPQQQDGMAALQGLQPQQQQLSPQTLAMFGHGPQVPTIQELTGQLPQKQPQEFAQPNKQSGLRIGASPIERRHRETLAAQKEARVQKETLPFYQEVIKEDKAAKENDIVLNRMEKLIEKGKLPPAGLYKFVRELQEKVPSTHGAAGGGLLGAAVGGPIGAAIGAGAGAAIAPIAGIMESAIKGVYPDTEEFEKLSTGFIRGAKNLFGNRVTNQELSTFLQTVPTLMQTDNGKKAIIKNMKIFNEAAHLKAETMKKVIKKYGGRPENFELIINEEMSKELDKLAKEFIS